MDKRIKIVLGIVVFLGILSGAFLLFAKKKPTATTTAVKTVQASAQVKSLTPSTTSQDTAAQTTANQTAQTGLPQQVATPQAVAPQATVANRKALIASQWKQCKDKTIAANTNLFWNVQITEGIPTGGTYAKGNLDNNTAFSVNVIIKKDSQIADKIKAMLVVGKMAFLRGNCTDVAKDGSVVLQAF